MISLKRTIFSTIRQLDITRIRKAAILLSKFMPHVNEKYSNVQKHMFYVSFLVLRAYILFKLAEPRRTIEIVAKIGFHKHLILSQTFLEKYESETGPSKVATSILSTAYAMCTTSFVPGTFSLYCP